jgi:outer membrane protein assembly factor BamB
MQLHADQICNIAELTIWKRHIADSHGLQLPMYSVRTNPLLAGESVIVTLCSCKRIAAFNRDTGALLWNKDLGYLAGSFVDSSGGYAYTATNGPFLCIDPVDGRIIWSYAPQGRHGLVYAGPAFSDDLVIFGDRLGRLNCFEAATGKRVWKVDLSPGSDWDINATACVFGNRVVACDIRGAIAAYQVQTGKLIWRSKFKRGSIFEIMNLDGDALITGQKELYRYSVSIGEQLERFEVKQTEPQCAAIAAGSHVCAVLRDLKAEAQVREKLHAVRKKGLGFGLEIIDNSSTTSLACLLPDGIAWSLNYPLYSDVHVRWDEPTGLIIEATNHGIGLIDPESGARRALIITEEQDDVGSVYFSPPAASDGLLYALTSQGDLYCLRWPE